jgi:hypothetical protein
MAVKILDKCNKDKPEYASEILNREMPEFDNCNCMEIAEASYSLNFISHSSFQDVLDKKWYNNISPYYSKFKVNDQSNLYAIKII